jgi:glycosyltransferase involved in cell wall biosynthesis
MDRPLRFCMVTTFYPPYNFGGDGIFVHRLSNELARRGHRVDVIHCTDAYRAVAGHNPANDYDNHPNVTVHGLKSALGWLSPLATQQTGFPFFKSRELHAVLRQNFDVIHYHNISLLGPKVLEYGRGLKLYTMHEYWLVCPTHVLFRFNRAACVRPHCLLCTLSYKRPPQWWRYFGLLSAAAKRVDAFIAPSRFSKEKHAQLGFTAPVVHLPHFFPETDEPASSGSSTEKKTTKPYFLFVGRLEKLKGAQTVIPIFHGYGKAELWIAGTGSYEPQLRSLAGNSTDIRFLGFLSEDRLRQLYRQAVAVIVPSICYETFGQVIIEAFSEKTPALVRHIGALPEIVEESGGGLTYDKDAELVTAMDELLSDPAHRGALGLSGYQAYLRNWTAEAHMQRYLALIHDVAAAKARRKLDAPEDGFKWAHSET